MTEKDIEKIYDDLEKYLIRNIKKNLTSDLDSFHLNEEKQLGFKWEAWQSAKLRELKKYRRQNKSIIRKRLKNISSQIAEVLRNENRQGKIDAFKNFKAALTHGFKSSIKVKDSFFKINDRKVNTLIKSVNNDFSEANKAVLRRSNDVYRQIIAEASMYNQTGVMTERQAIKKAIDDFSARGIDCIVYSNGARHKISNYAKMAIRTASTRAHLQGEGQLRQKIGQTLILMSKHNTACKLCQPFESKVLIDDVYSGGTKADGKYTLLSEAMKQGLYHPNCRHGHGTYYPELGKKESNNIIEEQEQRKQAVENSRIKELTQEEKEAVNYFKEGDDGWGYQAMRYAANDQLDLYPTVKQQIDNDNIFKAEYLKEEYTKLYNNLMSALHKAPPSEGTLYRYLNRYNVPEIGSEVKIHKLDSFTSQPNEKMTSQFGGEDKIVYKLKGNKNYRDISDIEDYSITQENESLAIKDMEYIVEKVEYKDFYGEKQYIVTLVEKEK